MNDYIIQTIAKLILAYYMAYRNLNVRSYDVSYLQRILSVIYDAIQFELSRYNFEYTLYSIEILELPNDITYLLDNDVDYKSMKQYLLDYLYTHRHTISNCDIIIAVNILPFEGIDIRHGDILNLLDRYFQ